MCSSQPRRLPRQFRLLRPISTCPSEAQRGVVSSPRHTEPRRTPRSLPTSLSPLPTGDLTHPSLSQHLLAHFERREGDIPMTQSALAVCVWTRWVAVLRGRDPGAAGKGCVGNKASSQLSPCSAEAKEERGGRCQHSLHPCPFPHKGTPVPESEGCELNPGCKAWRVSQRAWCGVNFSPGQIWSSALLSLGIVAARGRRLPLLPGQQDPCERGSYSTLTVPSSLHICSPAHYPVRNIKKRCEHTWNCGFITSGPGAGQSW
jgi:hypothetical protein